MQRTQGFSLIELMIALAIMVILVTVAIPGFQSTLIRINASSIADTLISSLNFARSEAMNRNVRISMCASLDGLTCDAGASDWNSGWIVSTLTPVGALDTVLRYKRIDTQNADIKLESNNAKIVIFKATGEGFFSLPVPIVGSDFTFLTQITGCDTPQLSVKRVIAVALSGALTVSTQACD